jgi:hypothetical protein
MFTFTIELPESIKVAVGDTGKETLVDIAAIAKAHPGLIRNAALSGFIGTLNNISRGKDDDGKANSDAVWAAMRAKRVDAWLAGDWAMRAGGERAMTQLKEAFIDERRAATGATIAQVERSIKDLVANTFGKEEAATFGRFLDAVALMMVRRDTGGDDVKLVTETREALEAKYQKLADEAKAARDKVSAKLDLTDISL